MLTNINANEWITSHITDMEQTFAYVENGGLNLVLKLHVA